MKKWHLVIDVQGCEDCNNCFLACKDEHVDNDWPGYTVAQPRHGHRWVDILRQERGQYPLIDVAYLPTLCNQCEDPPCIKSSGGAVYQRADGIVLIDPNKAKGRQDIVQSCPYHMIWWNEAQAVPQKCTFCAHLIDQGWKQPRCVQACPTGALRVEYVEDAEMRRRLASEQLECLHPEHKTGPRVYYKNLHRYTKCFLAGSVAVNKNGVIDCAAGAKVVLLQGRAQLGEAIADAFGDFTFDRLDPGSTGYLLEIHLPGFEKKAVEVSALPASLNVGTICF